MPTGPFRRIRMCFVYDVSGPTFYNEQIIKKSRKLHKCSECYKHIDIGNSYQYVIGVWDGDWSSYKICDKCQGLRKKIHDLETSHGCREHESWPPFGGLRDCLPDYEEELN
jgi:hypothetical protein